MFSNYLFPVSPFPTSSGVLPSPFFTSSKPMGRGAGILLPVHQFFFSKSRSPESSEELVVTTVTVQVPSDEFLLRVSWTCGKERAQCEPLILDHTCKMCSGCICPLTLFFYYLYFKVKSRSFGCLPCYQSMRLIQNPPFAPTPARIQVACNDKQV